VSKKQALELAADSPPTRRGATFLVTVWVGTRRRLAADSPKCNLFSYCVSWNSPPTRHWLAADSPPTRRRLAEVQPF